MKILLLNYHFPPTETPHAFRWAQIVERFKSEGHDVDVICGGRASEYTEAGLNRVNSPFIGNRIQSNTSILKKEDLGRFYGIKGAIKLFSKKIYRAFFWPDGLWHWLPAALWCVIARRKIHYDLVIGYSPTFSAVIAARFYKFLNSDTKLIVDFGDPFSVSKEMPVNNYKLYYFLNYIVERWVFNAASIVSFTNESTLNLYKEKYKKIDNFTVVPHVVDVDLFYRVYKGSPDSLVLGYVGAFHQGIRDPSLAIEILNKVANEIEGVEAVFYGPLNNVPFGVTDSVYHKGVVPREEAISLMHSFDFIINVENEECPMSPSKIFECKASGKPIINFLSGTKESSFSDYPLSLDVDSKTPVAEVVNFIMDNRGKQLSRIEVEGLLGGLTYNSISSRYLDIGKGL